MRFINRPSSSSLSPSSGSSLVQNWFSSVQTSVLSRRCEPALTESNKALKKKSFFTFFFRKTNLREKIFKILFRNNSSPRRSTCCVQIWRNLADGKPVKSWLLTLRKEISPGSPDLANARIVPKIYQSQPQTMYSESSRFHPIGSLSAKLYPNA